MQSAGDRPLGGRRSKTDTLELDQSAVGEPETSQVPRLSVSAINRLGLRIRHNELTLDDLAMLQRLRQEHFALLADVQSEIQDRLPGVVQTSRLKTVQTIVDKLRREPHMALSRMQDIAGVRIVEEMNRAEQTVLASDVLAAVGGGKLVDRRTRPRFGYRAVHLTVRRDQRSVEIQIRTRMQDQWAQIVERLGDSWGRQIRYGELPDEADRMILGNPKMTRRRLWNLVQSVATVVDSWEAAVVEHLGEPTADDATDTVGMSRKDIDEVLETIVQALELADRL